jgi:anhydro-N-acetylmuramic acid kinase
MRVIGLMSGTSYDAIDAAAADLVLDEEGAITLTPRGVLSRGYPEDLRAAVGAALPPNAITMEQVCQLDTRIGQAFAELAVQANEELCGGDAELVVSHGQTLFHWVSEGRVKGSLQLGQSAWIAEATGLPVVADLRSRDIAAGGQGAPLVSLFDVLWLGTRPGCPVALNLGGIANITVVSHGQDPVAFDTGPANALIDAGVRHLTDGALDYDVDGALAARGRIDEQLLQRLHAEPYYALPGPKTTGKELFHLPYLLAAMDGLGSRPPEDVIATLTALTATTVADAVIRSGGTEVIAAGGGVNNPTLMSMLAAELGDVGLQTTSGLGLPSGAKEAYAFATLGFLAVHGLPGTVASCTGARHASVLGHITPGRQPLVLPAAAAPPDRLNVAPAAA